MTDTVCPECSCTKHPGGSKALKAALMDRATIERRLRYVPVMARDNVRLRHDHMVALRAESRTLKFIADVLGLKDHTSVLYHLNGQCRCLS